MLKHPAKAGVFYPARDNKPRTARNSQPLFNSALPRKADFFLHFDGEFTSTENLVTATFTGRNFGWLANEKPVTINA